jgi:DNA-binding transcriptional ArsR family regulator
VRPAYWVRIAGFIARDRSVYPPGVPEKTNDPITQINDPRYLKALAHPLRIRVLAILDERDASPVQLANMLDESLGVVSYHVRTLLNLGLLKLVATRQRRGAVEHVYRAVEHPRFSDEAWAELGPVAKQRMLSAMLRQAGDYANGSAAAGGFDRADAHIGRHAFTLDERGWTELAAATKKWLVDADRIEQAAKKRLAKTHTDGHRGLNVGLILMLFEALPFSERHSSADKASRSRDRRRQSESSGR